MSLLALLSTALAVAPVPEAAQFGDWVVACDNGHHCEAVASKSRGETEDAWSVYFSRAAGPLAVPNVYLMPVFSGEGQSARFVIDGQTSPFGSTADGGLSGDASAFLSALARAQTVLAVDRSGQVIGTLPAAGASAALRWIDDRQRRAGTVTALVATGPRSATTVPPPPALPEISRPPRSDAAPRTLSATDRAAIMRFGDCDGLAGEAEYARLDAGHTLALVICWTGAYQASALAVVIDELGRWQPAPLEQAEHQNIDAEPFLPYLITSAEYDPQDGLLREFAKGRGLGDCGNSASWAWDGSMFRLASYHALDQCMGGPPGTFLSRWQTANDPVSPDE